MGQQGCRHENRQRILTADVHTLVEGCLYLGVHGDVELLLLGKIIISFLNLVLDPLSKRITYDSVKDFDDPLSRKPELISLLW